MERSLLSAVAKLAMFGEMAGFSLDEMIEFLDSGLSVLGLLDLIVMRLEIRYQAKAVTQSILAN